MNLQAFRLQQRLPIQVFSNEVFKMFKNTYFVEDLQMTASENDSERVRTK